MPRTEKYFIGPQLLGDIRQTVSRVSAMPQGSRIGKIPTRLQDMRPPGGGGGALKLGKTTAAWAKGTFLSVVEYNEGGALTETVSSPPSIIENCVNKFADVEANRWVMIGRANNRWYLVAAEC